MKSRLACDWKSIATTGSIVLALMLGAGPVAADDTPDNLIAWRAGLTSSAQPNKAFLAHLKDNKYDMLINLAPPKSHGSIELEGAIVGAQGLVYVNIPVDWEHPTTADFDMFSAALKGAGTRNVFVHCQANFRGGSFVLLYRAIYENAPVAELASRLNAIWAPDPVWKAFINTTLKQHKVDGEIF
jgi:protein tyrosine phosphatase (PTP) superfamily phosphohydrolase (DUF442 family)